MYITEWYLWSDLCNVLQAIFLPYLSQCIASFENKQPQDWYLIYSGLFKFHLYVKILQPVF